MGFVISSESWCVCVLGAHWWIFFLQIFSSHDLERSYFTDIYFPLKLYITHSIELKDFIMIYSKYAKEK